MNEALKYFKEYGKALERMNSSRKRLVSIWYSYKSIQYRITKAAIIRERHYRKRRLEFALHMKEYYKQNT